jgi:hypothetical protein
MGRDARLSGPVGSPALAANTPSADRRGGDPHMTKTLSCEIHQLTTPVNAPATSTTARAGC